MIGQHDTTTTEYTVCRLTDGTGYLVECDGTIIPDPSTFPTIAAAHKAAKAHARKSGASGAGLTETFGRNRQFVMTSRGAWNRFRGE